MTTPTATKERPILFSGPMVQAILEGRKTQTRRVIKPQPRVFAGSWYQRNADHIWYDQKRSHHWHFTSPSGKENLEPSIVCPYGQPSDQLWVRETWMRENYLSDDSHAYYYRADNNGPGSLITAAHMWKPSIHMPRAASRLTLEITDVRVERVQDISREDAIAEGVDAPDVLPRSKFAALWDSINEARGYGWDINPWVWVVSFRRVQP